MHWAPVKLTAADLSEEIRVMVARKLCRAPILTISTSEDEPDSDAGNKEPPRRRHPLKSGDVCTTDSMVVKKVTWPHELVNTTAGQAAAYEDQSSCL